MPSLPQLQVGDLSSPPWDGTSCAFGVRSTGCQEGSPSMSGWEGSQEALLVSRGARSPEQDRMLPRVIQQVK